MTRILELACGLMLLVSPALGGAPSIFCEKPIYKFGDHSQYETAREPSVDVPFIIENRGDTDLIITKIHLSCGCTEYRWGDQADTKQGAPHRKKKAPERKIIPPGKKERLTIVLDTLDVTFTTSSPGGKYDFKARIHSNDPEKPLYVLSLRGRRELAFAAPQQISLGDIHLGRGKTLTFQIRRLKRARPSKHLKRAEYIRRLKMAKSDIVGLTSTAPFISARIAKRPTGHDSRYTIEVAVLKDAPTGVIDHRLTFSTNDARQKSFDVQLTGKVIADIDVSVERILFGPVSRKTEPSREIFITQGFSKDGEDLQVLDAKIDSKHVSIETEVVKEGARYRLRIKLKPDAPVGTLMAKLVISTNKDGFKTIEIPVFALVRQ